MKFKELADKMERSLYESDSYYGTCVENKEEAQVVIELLLDRGLSLRRELKNYDTYPMDIFINGDYRICFCEILNKEYYYNEQNGVIFSSLEDYENLMLQKNNGDNLKKLLTNGRVVSLSNNDVGIVLNNKIMIGYERYLDIEEFYDSLVKIGDSNCRVLLIADTKAKTLEDIMAMKKKDLDIVWIREVEILMKDLPVGTKVEYSLKGERETRVGVIRKVNVDMDFNILVDKETLEIIDDDDYINILSVLREA